MTAITRGNVCSPTAWEALRTPRIVGQGPRLNKNGKSIICKTDTFVPLVVPGWSTSSGCNSSETSTPQDVSSTSPAQERSDERAPRRWCGSTPKTQNQNKRGMTVEIRTTVCEIFLSGWRSSQIFWRTQNCMHPHTVRINQIQNILRKPYHKQGNTELKLTSQKDRNCEDCLRNGNDKASLQKTHLAKLYHEQKSLVPMRRVGSSHSMDPGVSVQNKKTSQETKKSLQKFLEPTRKPKVIYTDNSLEFGTACEDFYGIIELIHSFDSRRMVLLKEQYAE